MIIDLPTGDFRAVIYDCDGTLADSMMLHHRAWCGAFARAGARFEFTWELFMSRAGMGLLETVRNLNAQFGEQLDAECVVAWQHEIFASLLPELKPIPEVIAHARANRTPQCVASGGERALVERELELLGVRELFAFVVCPDDVRHGKPDPEMFLLCADRMKVEPRHCLVFEDGPLGLEAARAAGMAWVAVDGTGRSGSAPAL